MANEIGYWNGGAGTGTVRSIFLQEQFAVLGPGIHTAAARERVNKVRFAVSPLSGSGIHTYQIGLYAVAAGIPTGKPVYPPTTLRTDSTSQWTFETDVDWPLTNGVSYTLAIGLIDGLPVEHSTDTLTNGNSTMDNYEWGLAAWIEASKQAVILEIAGDVTTSASTPRASSRYVAPRSWNPSDDDDFPSQLNIKAWF